MAKNTMPALKSEHKGYLLILSGILILLYAFNFFAKWLNAIVIIVGILLVVYGFLKIDGVQRIQRIFRRR